MRFLGKFIISVYLIFAGCDVAYQSIPPPGRWNTVGAVGPDVGWFHYQGDSITSGIGWNEGDYPWYANPGGLQDQIEASYFPHTVGYSGSGVAGATAAGVAAQIPSTMYLMIPAQFTAPTIVIECGINDAYRIEQGLEVIGDFSTGYASIISQILSKWPAARIIGMSCFCFTEAWATGPTWTGTRLETQIAAVDAQIASQIGAVPGAKYVDIRTPLLAWEVVNNPAKDPSGHAGIGNGAEASAEHPTYLGMAVMAAAFLANVTP